MGKKRLTALKTIFFKFYSGFGRPLLEYWVGEARFLLKTYWARRLCWPAARKLRNSGIQNFETLILAQKGKNPSIFHIFSAFFPNIWPLARPNIARKGWPLLGKALERVWEGFGKFCAFWKGLRVFCVCFARVLRVFCACFWKSLTFKP